jgi:hypothetical protein
MNVTARARAAERKCHGGLRRKPAEPNDKHQQKRHHGNDDERQHVSAKPDQDLLQQREAH